MGGGFFFCTAVTRTQPPPRTSLCPKSGEDE